MTRKLLLILFLLITPPIVVQTVDPLDISVPDSLDFDRRQSGMYRFELSPYGGDYFGDKTGHSFIVGNNIQWNLTEKLALSTDFGYSRAVVDPTSVLGASFQDKNVYLIDGGFVITVPAAYRSGKGYTEADFFTSIGGGIIRINDSNRGGGYIGGGMKIRFKKADWFGLRVEIRNYFTSIDNPSGSNFQDTLSIRLGPTFLLPPEL